MLLRTNLPLSRFSPRLMAKIISVLIALIPICFLLSLGHVEQPRALVKADAWTTHGVFPKLPNALDPMQVSPEFLADPAFVTFRSFAPGGATVGQVISAPFNVPRYMAVPFARGGYKGYGNPDRIFLQCLSSEAQRTVSSARTIGEWSVAYLRISRDFCHGPIKLVAESNNGLAGAYLGVGTPFEVSRPVYLAHSEFATFAFIILVTWLCLGVILLAGAVLNARFGNRFDAFAAGAIALGAAAMLIFLAGARSGPASRTACGLVLACSALIVIRGWVSKKELLVRLGRELWLPLFSWLAVAIILGSFLNAADSGGGSWTANSIFSPLSWSTDNQNPIELAQLFATTVPRGSIEVGGWLFDDRTPLLPILLLIPQTLVVNPLARLFGLDFAYLGDGFAALTILAFWMPVLIWTMRQIRTARPLLLLAIVAISPLTLYNTVYSWGKLLGGAYVLLAVGLILISGRAGSRTRWNFALIPAALALGFLSHAGNAMSALAMIIVFLPIVRKKDVKVLAIGTMVALILYLPWVYWAKVLQPGGTALTRYQLANDLGFDHRMKPMLDSVTEMLNSWGWTRLLQQKMQSFALIFRVFGPYPFGAPLDADGPSFISNQRTLDFIAVSRAFGIAIFGVIGVIGAALLRRRPDALALRLALAGILAVVGMVLLTIQIGIASSHAYGSLLMLSLAGAIFLTQRWPRATAFFFALYLVYFVAAWVIDPLEIADRIHWLSVITALAWLAALMWAIGISRNSLSSKKDHNVLWPPPSAAT